MSAADGAGAPGADPGSTRASGPASAAARVSAYRTPAPRATYRLQLRGGVTFQHATELVPYLSALGVSHLYCSPIALARSQSEHGYDVIDPTRIDPALGGEPGLTQLVRALRDHGMGLVIDWVPNHVGIAHGENRWWQDVLEFGPASPYAEFFDIDWEPARPELRGKILLPVLGRHYGDVLESGEIEPEWDREQGLRIRYHEHAFPVSPTSCARFLLRALYRADAPVQLGATSREELRAALLSLAARVRSTRGAARAAGEKRALVGRVAADSSLAAVVHAAVLSLRGEKGCARSFEGLHRLLEQQHYRLAYWRVAAEEINYRRFFDINELAALRMERSDVFEHTHQGVLRWIEAGLVDGLRIDHIDGLAEPRRYCLRLRQSVARRGFYLVIEKILGADEVLRRDWRVEGTTGYEFLNQLNGLFVDPNGRAPLDRLAASFTQDPSSFDAVLYASKKRVMQALLAGDLESLASRLDRIAQSGRWTRDYTRSALRDALEEIVAFFPVYRSYVSEHECSPEDRRHVASAVREARRQSVDPESGLFEWIERVLTLDLAADTPEELRQEAQRFVTRFQQYTAPVMAKGLEDTSFYRYHRLTSLNEVGGDPRRFGVTPRAFHAANLERATRWPRALLCTSSHDTKRGEDARGRIDVLSEPAISFGWHVRSWATQNRSLKRSVHGEPAPSSKDEYLIYQVLLGTWPVEELDADALQGYCARVQQYMEKALREGKERSSWRYPDREYERATCEFVADLLSPGAPFLAAFRPLQGRVAERGAQNSLSALVLKLCSPGVPDLYQGSELWDLSLTDPDNRRPVDFGARERALRALERELGPPGAPVARRALISLLRSWRDARIKLFLTWRLLALRESHPELFVGAPYLPLTPRGVHARQLVAFARTRPRFSLLVIAPRLAAGLVRDETPFPLGIPSWGDTGIVLPRNLRGLRFRDVLTGQGVGPGGEAVASGAGLRAADCLDALPVAVLLAER